MLFENSDIIREIGTWLNGKAFYRFAETSKGVRKVFAEDKELSAPKAPKEVLSIVTSTPLWKISALASQWDKALTVMPSAVMRGNADKRGRKYLPTVCSLKASIRHFKKFSSSKIKQTFDEVSTSVGQEERGFHRLIGNFSTYVKCLNILNVLGDPDSKETYKNLYHAVQTVYAESVGESPEDILHPQLYKLSYEAFSFLNPATRKGLASRYAQGTAPFEKNSQKAQVYERPINLPLNPALFRE